MRLGAITLLSALAYAWVGGVIAFARLRRERADVGA